MPTIFNAVSKLLRNPYRHFGLLPKVCYIFVLTFQFNHIYKDKLLTF